MDTATRQIVFFVGALMWLCLSTMARPFNDSHQTLSSDKLFELGKSIRYTYPDSSITLLDQSMAGFLKAGDTLSAVNTLFVSANVVGNLANYKDAYDRFWKGLLLADLAGLERERALLYIEIGRHFSFYKRSEKAMEYFHTSLNLNKSLLAAKKLDEAEMVSNYFAFAKTYRELGELDQARVYLDSCFQYYEAGKSRIDKAYLQFELACIHTAEKKYQEALDLFQELEPWFEENEPSYLVLFYTYLGDLYLGLDNDQLSETSYKKGIQISDQYHMHLDFSPLIYERLSSLYLQRGDFQKAYGSLKTVKELDARFFDSRSSNNQSLLEIQDAFRQEKKAQEELIQKQKLEQLERDEDVWFLQRVILIGSIVFIITVGLLFFNYIRAKYRADKQLIRKEKELELEKANEVLEIKNKELATSALKLIEKDEDLSLLKSKIKEIDGDVNVHELKKVVKSISVSNNRNWEEFETRFVAVNESFYKKLQEKFPKLTQRDLKLCALIKLNFSSKEMAKLLGISVESAHTSRYRLRKKLNLTRDVNLTEFIASQT